MAVSPAILSPGTTSLVSALELSDFYKKHFSSDSQNYFAANFLAEETTEEDDDGLGYYKDGVKRTLTDEQIAIFRHTEIETLLKDKRRSNETKANAASTTRNAVSDEPSSQFSLVTGPQAPETRLIPLETPQPFAKKPGPDDQRKKRSNFKRNIKPDLRKRTWDKVDSGLETLAYEEEVTQSLPKRNAGPQRRKVSYDDV